jgi:hypothetical protein
MERDKGKSILDNRLLRIFVVALFLSTLWSFFGVSFIVPIFEQNFWITFPLFVLIYSAAVYYAVFKKNPTQEPRMFLALSISFVIFDLLMFPYLITTLGMPANLPSEAKISSDVWLYQMLPSSIPEWGKYFIVYPLSFSVGILLIAFLTDTPKKFKKIMQEAM